MKHIAILALAALTFGACQTSPELEAPEVVETPEIENPYDYSAELKDVTGGSAFGMAFAALDGEFSLSAELSNLPALEDDFFYEGWLVRKSPLSVISTGEATPIAKAEGEFLNVFTSEDDLSDHTTYILTLEPDDGDPAPAAHVLEGELTLIN